jgi:hypothetical protein
MYGDHEPLYRAPSNAVREPPGKDRKHGHASRYMVLARLRFGHRIHIVPGEVTWTSWDCVRVEWQHRPGRMRVTWLAKADICSRIVY